MAAPAHRMPTGTALVEAHVLRDAVQAGLTSH